jgi:hypothetical protein
MLDLVTEDPRPIPNSIEMLEANLEIKREIELLVARDVDRNRPDRRYEPTAGSAKDLQPPLPPKIELPAERTHPSTVDGFASLLTA